MITIDNLIKIIIIEVIIIYVGIKELYKLYKRKELENEIRFLEIEKALFKKRGKK